MDQAVDRRVADDTHDAIADRAPPRRRVDWQRTAINLFVLVLIGALVAFAAFEWDWWLARP